MKNWKDKVALITGASSEIGEATARQFTRAGPVRTEVGETALQKENGGHVLTEKIGVSAEHVAWHIWKLLLRPRRVIFVPRWLRIVPWLELSFGWMEDLLGPMLLKRRSV